MEKEQNSKTEEKNNNKIKSTESSEKDKKIKEKEVELSPEEKIKELEEKLTRTLAEMENQRRRFEKEKDDAFEYGGFSFARESLNLIDNFDRAKQSLESDEKLKNSDALKKTLEHLDIIKKDLLSIFKKNNIDEIISNNSSLSLYVLKVLMGSSAQTTLCNCPSANLFGLECSNSQLAPCAPREA